MQLLFHTAKEDRYCLESRVKESEKATVNEYKGEKVKGIVSYKIRNSTLRPRKALTFRVLLTRKQGSMQAPARQSNMDRR